MTLRRHTGALLLLALSCAFLLALPVSAHALDTVWWAQRYVGPFDMTDASDNNVPVAGAANGVAFSDSTRGWMVGVRGDAVGPAPGGVRSSWYAFTSDGGSIWTSESIPATSELLGVAAPASDNVVAVGENGTIARFNGLSWTVTRVAGWSGKHLRAVAFADTSHGWAVGDGRGILKTVDGGVNWTTDAAPGASGAYYGIAALDATHVWVVGDAGSMKSWNGSIWTAKTSGTGNTLRAIAFKDATHGRAVGDNATFVATSDGATWSLLSVPMPPAGTAASARSISYSTTGTCFVVGTGMSVWRTSDDGLTWLAGDAGTNNLFKEGAVSGLDLTGVIFVPGGSGLPVAVGRDSIANGLTDGQNCKAFAFAATDWLRTAPSAPPYVPTASQVGTAAAIKVEWYDYEKDVLGFTVERSSAGGSYSTVATVGAVPVAPDKYSWTDSSVSADTTYTYRMRAYSSAGFSVPSAATVPLLIHVLVSPVTSHTVTPPSPDGSNGWYVATPTVSVARDVAGLTYFGLFTQPTSTYSSNPGSPYAFGLNQGNVTYGYFGVSSFGITETPVHSVTVKLDSRAPVTTSNAVATYTASASIALTPTDTLPGSGLARTRWSIDGSAATSGTTASTSVIAAHTLSWSSIDVAGNREATKTAVFAVVTSPAAPVTSHTVAPPSPDGSNGWYVATPTVSVSRDIGGRIYTGLYSQPTSAYSWDSSTPYTLGLNQGNVIYGYFGVSSLGITETPVHPVTIKLDSRAPVTTSNALPTTYTTAATITLTPSDPAPGSGLAGTRWSVDGAAATSGTAASIATTGSHILTWSSIDVAGNREATKSANVSVAPLAPPAVAATSVTIKTTATSARIGNIPILSGAVTPFSTVGYNMVAYVMKPGKTYWTYSSNRTVYNLGGKAAWQYKYYFKPGMVKGVYKFKAVMPAYTGHFLASQSPTTVSITLR